MAGFNMIVEWIAIALSYALFIITLPWSLWFCFQTNNGYNRGVIFRLGRVKGARRGLYFILPCVDKAHYVDIRVVSYEVPPQEVLTGDSVSVSVDAVIYYKISDPVKSVLNVVKADLSTRLLAATTLRTSIGMRDMSELLSNRSTISHMMESTLHQVTESWGILVERVDIRDIRLPVDLQRAMAAEAEAAREARAKIIAAEGEIQATKALQEASDIMSNNPMALQLRYLQTITTMTAEKHSTVIFPFPMHLVQPFFGGGGAGGRRTAGRSV